MGGYESGRQGGWGRDTVEDYRSLDVNQLHADGCLAPGWSGGRQWTRDGKQTASIRLRAETDRIMLSYHYCLGAGEWQDIEEAVGIVRVPCRFGGERPYFLCPGVVNGIACGRRVAKLHGAGRYFLCRHCHRLAYASQRLDPLERRRQAAQDRASRIKRRLGGTGRGSPNEAIPPRPKGMRRKTYRRLRQQVVEAEGKAESLFWVQAAAIVEQADRADCRRQ
jgi:hypothetical protein